MISQAALSATDRSLLERRERLQRALATCSQRLVANTTGAAEERVTLATALEHLRDGARVLRVVLFENYTHGDAGFCSRPVAEAWAPGEQPLSEAFGPQHHIPWSLVPEANRHALEAGEHVGGPVQELFADAPRIADIERHLGIGTVQFFSIFVHGQWWGYLGFDDRAARQWDDQEVLLIRTAATLIGSFLQRNRDVAALREREAMLRALGDNLPDALVYQLEELPDGSTRLTYLSRGLEHRTGISTEQALADADRRFVNIHEQDAPAVRAADLAASAGPSPFDQEFRYYAADGSIRWMRARSTPRRLGDDCLLWDGIAIDITAYRLLQDSLRLANLGLSRRVDELSLLNQVAQLLGSVTDLPETLGIVCRLLRDTFRALDVAVALHTASAPGLQIVAYDAQDDGRTDRAGTLHAAAASVADNAGPTLIEDSANPEIVTLIVQLHAQGEAIGLLQIRVDQRRQQIMPETVSLAQTIAGAIAGAAANARLYAQAVRSTERLERLNAASRMINAVGLELPALYAAIHRAVAHLMPVEAFVISLVEPESCVVEHVYNYDRGGLDLPGQSLLEDSFAGFMRRYGPSLRVDDFLGFYAQHPEVGFDVYGDEEDTRSGLAASFVTADGLYGLLFAQCYPPGAYDDDDLIILELLAAHAATAIENARRAQQARLAAVDEERNRLARDLHDSVSQSLFSASMIAERLPAMAQISTADAWEGLDLLHQLVRGALTEMRALLIELRPAALASAPLHQAIDQLVRAFSARRGIPITLHLDVAPQLPQAVQVALYRIVQECLSNVVKHAHARSADVRMAVQPPVDDAPAAWAGTIVVEVSDDGRGFEAAEIGGGRLGIGIMRERAAAIGAQLDLVSQPGQGTQVRLVWRGESTGGEL